LAQGTIRLQSQAPGDPCHQRVHPPPPHPRRNGLRVRLVDAPFEQPLGYRKPAEMWRRQVRWARLRRTSFKAHFVPEILAGGAWPMAAAFSVGQSDLSLASVPALAVVWYGGEAVSWAAGWHLTVRSPLAWALRDLLLPAIGSTAGSTAPLSGAATACSRSNRAARSSRRSGLG
jgi:ceramide glucosyltransferase